MPRRWSFRAIVLVTLVFAAPLSAQNAPAALDPTVAAATLRATRALEAAPADATIWIRIEDGTGLGRSGECAALAQTIAAKFVLRAGSVQWSELSRRLGFSERETFERYLGTDARLAIRSDDGSFGGTYDWVLLTRVAEADMDRLVASLHPAIGARGRFELPEDKLVLAYRAPWLVVGSTAKSPLFADVAERFDATLERNLATATTDAGLDGVPPAGRVSAAIVLPPPFAGRGLLGADVRDGKLKVAFRGAFARAPLPGAEQTTFDVSLLARFDDAAVAMLLDPVKKTVEPDDAFIVSTLPELVPPATFRGNLGQRRLVLVGEVDGSAAKPPLHMRCPAIAIAYEVDDADQARDDQDALMTSTIAGISQRVARPAGIELPPASIPPEGARSASIAPLVEMFTENHPLTRTWSLNWQIVKGPGGGAWQVYATHPEWLATVSSELSARSTERPNCVTASSAGRCCGGRLASHLRSWTGEAEAFTKGDGKAGSPEGFSQGIELLASLAERFRHVQWTIGTPGERRLSIDIDAALAPATSTSP